MKNQEIKKAADELVREHFKEWFLLTEKEIKQITLNEDSAPKGIIRTAIVTVKAKKEMISNFYINTESEKEKNAYGVENLFLSTILKELEDRL